MVWEVWEVLLLWYTGVVLMGLSTSHLQHTPSSPLIHLYDVINCAQLITSRDGARETPMGHDSETDSALLSHPPPGHPSGLPCFLIWPWYRFL